MSDTLFRASRALCEALETRTFLNGVPAAPSGLDAAPTSFNSIQLNWVDQSSDESNFRIFRKGPGSAGFVQIGSTGANTTTYTDTTAIANAAYFYRVRATNVAGASVFSQTQPVWTPNPGETIVDDADTTRVTLTGSWNVNTSGQRYGLTQRLDGNSGKGQKSVVFSAPLPAGRFEVFTRWTAGANRSTTTPVLVEHAGGISTVVVNQSINGGRWMSLGTFNFNNPEAVHVTISNANTTGIVVADAVRFVSVTAPDVQWSVVAASPVPKDEAQVATLDGKMFVFGGFLPTGPTTQSHVYDPATNQWSAIAPMPTRLSHAATAVVGRDVYFAGGYVGTGVGFNQVFGVVETWKYNVDTNTYAPFVPLPQARGSGGLVHLNGKLHFFGGVSRNRADQGTHWVIDLSNPNAGWTVATPMPEARSHLSYVAFQGKIYAIGGQTDTDADLVTRPFVHVYDPASPGAWTRVADLLPARSHASSSTFVMNNRIVVMGGEYSHGQHITDVVTYDPLSNTWTALDSLPQRRSSGVGVLIGMDLFFSGGVGKKTTFKGVFLG